MKLFEAGNAELKTVSGKDLLQRDFKTFIMNGKKVGVGQLEVVNLAFLIPRKDDLLKAMGELKVAEGYHSVFLMLTDIMREGSDFLIVCDDAGIVETALGVKPQGSSIWIPGLMSRKKQVIPGLEKAFQNLSSKIVYPQQKFSVAPAQLRAAAGLSIQMASGKFMGLAILPLNRSGCFS